MNTSDSSIKGDIKLVADNIVAKPAPLVGKGKTPLPDITAEDILDLIENLNVYTYALKKPTDKAKLVSQTVEEAIEENKMEDIQLGILADELINHKLFPYVGYKDIENEGIELALKFNGLTVVALKGVQILLKRIKNLENESNTKELI